MSTQPAAAVVNNAIMRSSAEGALRNGDRVGASAGAASAAAASTIAAAATAHHGSAAIPRVLSIQSSVVFGYVGNKASNFPLQLLGFDVDPLHSCQLSNHTNYPGGFRGQRASGEDVSGVEAGLRANDLLREYSHVLTGYMTSIKFLEQSVELIKAIREARPDMLFVCDPVLGDLIEGGAGKLYVPAEFIDIYRTRLLPLADVWTPNQFEAEQLSGLRIDDEASARQCLQWFHARGVRTVIITSCTYRKSASSSSSSDAPNLIHVLGSTIDDADVSDDVGSSAASSRRRLRVAHMAIPRLDKYFTGTGDLTAALLLAWLTRSHKQEQEQLAAKQGSAATAAAAAVPSGPPRFSFATLCVALERSMATLQAVIRRTYDAQSSELLLIQAKQDIEQPQPTILVDELGE